LAEEVEVGNGRKGDQLTVQHLRKVYGNGGKVAIRDLTFGVKKGEIFGFLGTNGAGKTTTVSVLSGEFLPTAGRAFIGNYDVVLKRDEARQNLGYCPQFDALLEYMTPEEHLNMFARIRGIPIKQIKQEVDRLLVAMSLVPYRNKIAKDLSGGNKRKLSIAIALVGGPPVVFLDEPSAGMDPLSRRGLWKALEKCSKGRCVILTTHHLEEVEALAHRVAIMVEGNLVCIGSLQHLKSKFGHGYELQARVEDEKALGEMIEYVCRTFGSSRLIEQHGMKATFEIPKASSSLGEMFEIIERVKEELGIVDYSISQTSLEQVFLRVSAKALNEE